jgi:hypothetical protein
LIRGRVTAATRARTCATCTRVGSKPVGSSCDEVAAASCSTRRAAFRPFGQLLDALARLRQVRRQTVELVPIPVGGLDDMARLDVLVGLVDAGRHRGLARKARERVSRVRQRPHVFFGRRFPESDASTVVERHRQTHARL